MRNLADRLFGPDQAPAVLAGLATAYAGLLGRPETHRVLITQSFGFSVPDCHSPLHSFVKGWIEALDNPEVLEHPTTDHPEIKICAIAAAMYPWRMVLPPANATQEYFSACNRVLQKLGLEIITDARTCYLPLALQEKRYPLGHQGAYRFWQEFHATFENGVPIKRLLLQHVGRLLPHSSAALEQQA